MSHTHTHTHTHTRTHARTHALMLLYTLFVRTGSEGLNFRQQIHDFSEVEGSAAWRLIAGTWQWHSVWQPGFGSIQPNWSVSVGFIDSHPQRSFIPSHLMACGAAGAVALLWISLVFLWTLSNWLSFIALLATVALVLSVFVSCSLPSKHTDLFNFLLGLLLLCSG